MRLIGQEPDFWVFDKASGQTVDTAGLESIEGGFLVHRLDKGTTGVLLVARHRVAAAELSQAFRARQVEKGYEFLSPKAPRLDVCRLPIASDPRRPRRWTTRPDGRDAHTDFEVRARGEGLVLVGARPRTGRTHQIRVHARASGAPILGDLDYGGVQAIRKGGRVLRAERVMLHARWLSFEWRGRVLRFEADWPADFRALAALTTPRAGSDPR